MNTRQNKLEVKSISCMIILVFLFSEQKIFMSTVAKMIPSTISPCDVILTQNWLPNLQGPVLSENEELLVKHCSGISRWWHYAFKPNMNPSSLGVTLYSHDVTHLEFCQPEIIKSSRYFVIG